MKGLVFLAGIIIFAIAMNIRYARKMARRDPVDPEALKKAHYPRASGH